MALRFFPDVNECDSDPCQNGGTVAGYNGVNCEIGLNNRPCRNTRRHTIDNAVLQSYLIKINNNSNNNKNIMKPVDLNGLTFTSGMLLIAHNVIFIYRPYIVNLTSCACKLCYTPLGETVASCNKIY